MPTADPFRDIFPTVSADAAALTLPTRLELIGGAVEYLRHRAQLCGACDDERGGRLVLALHEALTNAMVHGNLEVSSDLKERPDDAFARALAARTQDAAYAGRHVDVRFAYDGTRCDFVITDQGPGFDPSKVPDPAAGHDEEAADDGDDGASFNPAALEAMLKCSGRGITIMRAMVDELRYEQGGRQCVLSICKGSCPLPATGDRRGDDRRPMHESVRLLPVRGDGTVDWSTAFDALTRNVSTGGIAVLQPRNGAAAGLAPAGRVLIEMHGGDGKPVFVPAEVCRMSHGGDGLVQLGCRFVAQPQVPAHGADTAAKVNALLGRLSRPADDKIDERRAHPRIAYMFTIDVHAPGDPAPRTAFSRDVSRGGMAFVTSFELPPGRIELTLPVPGGERLRIPAHVVRCQRITHGVYDCGVRFE